MRVGAKRGDVGLAFAGLHLGYLAGVEHYAAVHLHVEETVTDAALDGLTDSSERFRQQSIERFAGLQAAAVCGSLVCELCGGECFKCSLQLRNLLHIRPPAGDFASRMIEEALEYAKHR